MGRAVVDKHSTGGVADAVSLVFGPLIASLGLACVKISGRGLGHTGGTIDKLESIPGFRVDLSIQAMRSQAREVGCVIASQTDELVPADGMIYALRDATATVPSIPLIASSVMAKKLAIDADLILLDVKAGSGAFMADVPRASALAEACLAIAETAGRRALVAITDMSQPLGVTIGNALEVAEAVSVLAGRTRGRLRDAAVAFAARSLTALAGDTPPGATSAPNGPSKTARRWRRSGASCAPKGATSASRTIPRRSFPRRRCGSRSRRRGPDGWRPSTRPSSAGRRRRSALAGIARTRRSTPRSVSC